MLDYDVTCWALELREYPSDDHQDVIKELIPRPGTAVSTQSAGATTSLHGRSYRIFDTNLLAQMYQILNIEEVGLLGIYTQVSRVGTASGDPFKKLLG